MHSPLESQWGPGGGRGSPGFLDEGKKEVMDLFFPRKKEEEEDTEKSAKNAFSTSPTFAGKRRERREDRKVSSAPSPPSRRKPRGTRFSTPFPRENFFYFPFSAQANLSQSPSPPMKTRYRRRTSYPPFQDLWSTSPHLHAPFFLRAISSYSACSSGFDSERGRPAGGDSPHFPRKLTRAEKKGD